MKTGLAVEFRNRDVLRSCKGPDAIPLFHACHIRRGRIAFPNGECEEYLATGRNGLIQKNENYLFVKRFASKEESRRLQCGVYLRRDFPEYDFISTENKINFIAGADGLPECAVFGLYALFNSTLYDCYYRALNGSTQVNATEINRMPIPDFDCICRMGRTLIAANAMSVEICDRILERNI